MAEPGVSERTIRAGGDERVYQVTVPESYDGETPMPVVLGLHALTMSYEFVPALSGFPDMADRYDFVAVSPSGRLDGSVPYWNAAPTRKNDDIVFLIEVLDAVAAELCVDESQVFSTGMSNGAQMSSLLACQRSDRVTAVAPIAGAEFYVQCEGDPVPVIAFHGTADPIVTYDGAGLNARAISAQHYWKGNAPASVPVHGGVDEAMRRWADHNECVGDPVEVQVTVEVRKRTWQDCAAETTLYIVDGGGHTYPGRPVAGFDAMFGPTTTDIDATALMFEFFLGAPRAESPPQPDARARQRAG